MRKMFALLLATSLLFSLAGCKSDKDNKDNKDNKESESKASAEVAEVQIISKIKGSDCDYKIIYDDAHHIQRVTPEFEGADLEFTFNDAGQVLSKCYVFDEDIIAAKFDNAGAEGRLYDFYYYDAYGNEINPGDVYFYDKNGRIIYRYTEGETNYTDYSYNEAGQLIRLETTSGDYDGTTYTYEETFTYDNKGNLIERNDSNDSPTKYTYDDKGRLISYIGSHWTGSYEYNADDTISKMVEDYDSMVYTFEFEYETVSVPKDQVAAIKAERQYIYDSITTMFW